MQRRSWNIDERKILGWGSPDETYDISDRPRFLPFFKKQLNLKELKKASSVPPAEIPLPEQIINRPFLDEAKRLLPPDSIKTDHETRLRHSFGQSNRDLIRLRLGLVEGSPDAVIYPGSHNEVQELMLLAKKHDVCLIPFGGGTNIVGSLDRPAEERRMTVALDLCRMNRLLEVDPYSQTARFQCGVYGPDLEAQLAPHGLELGHYPDSFYCSTLGGWIATRSAGMHSNAYGKIEEMVVQLKIATPEGTIETKKAPASSAGPDFNRILAGSEGILGVITEATMQVHSLPEVREFQAFMFPTFSDGIAALRGFVQEECLPGLARLMDAKEMAFVSSLAREEPPFQTILAKGMKWYLKSIKGFDPKQQCLLFVCIEGSKDKTNAQRKGIRRVVSRNGGVALGKGPGTKWYHEVFQFPLMRDMVYSHGIIGDAAETATVWSNIEPLYEYVQETMQNTWNELDVSGYVMCHLSHVYETGTSIYFILVCPEIEGMEIEQHKRIREAVTRAMLEAGGTLTHHHAVGSHLKHLLSEENGATSVTALRAVKQSLDHSNIMNPGKVLPDPAPEPDWKNTEISSPSDVSEQTEPARQRHAPPVSAANSCGAS